jgi:hypothetical protein
MSEDYESGAITAMLASGRVLPLYQIVALSSRYRHEDLAVHAIGLADVAR